MKVLILLSTIAVVDAANAKCSTKYVDNGASATGTKVACGTTNHIVKGDALCAAAACDKEATDTNCCKIKALCSTKFTSNLATSVSGKTACGVGKYVSSTAYCAKDTCDATTDLGACCTTSGKCSTKFQLNSGVSTTLTKCAVNQYVDDWCAGGTCSTTSDSTNCCKAQALCSTKFQLSDGTSTTHTKCHSNEVVGARCAKGACVVGTDKKACCKIKKMCKDGFEPKGGKTATKYQCALADMAISSTAYCADTVCATTDDSVCCNQPCQDGFVLKGAKAGYETCKVSKDNVVSKTAQCASTVCVASDDATCCVKASSETNNSTNKSSNSQGHLVLTSLVATIGVAVMIS